MNITRAKIKYIRLKFAEAPSKQDSPEQYTILKSINDHVKSCGWHNIERKWISDNCQEYMDREGFDENIEVYALLVQNINNRLACPGLDLSKYGYCKFTSANNLIYISIDDKNLDEVLIGLTRDDNN